MYRSFHKLFGCLLLALFSNVAVAEEESAYSTCLKETLKEAETINNAVVLHCSEVASEKYKEEIRVAYRKIIKGYIDDNNPERAQAFEEAQKAWIDYRNKHCRTVNFHEPYCLMQMNEERANELKTWGN